MQYDKTSLILKNLPIGYALHRIVVDDTGHPVDYVFLEVNPAFESFTGLRAEFVIGKKVTEIIPGIEKEAFNWVSFYGEVAFGGSAQTFEQFAEHLGRWYAVTAFSHERGYFITLFNDITEAKRLNENLEREVERRTAELSYASEQLARSNELLEKLFNNSSYMIALMDADLNFIRVNEAYARADGHEPDYYVGKNHFALFPHEENEVIFRNVVKTGEPYIVFAKPFEYTAHPERGVTYWDWSLQPIKNASGKIEAVTLVLVDVTKRVRAQSELMKTQHELDHAKRLSDIGTLAATMAHEMRNPLAAISAALYNLRKKAGNPALEKHFATIEKKVLEGNQIISNLLNFSRIKMPRFEETRVQSVLDECSTTIAQKYSTWNVTLEKRSGCAPGETIIADPTQLGILFTNIIDNAYQALPDKRGTVRIATFPAGNGSCLGVAIEDNGAGIDQKHRYRIFEPFFTTRSKGTGLGLAICRQIVDLHGGKIEVESEKGKGTTFKITLSKRPAASHSAE